MPLTTPRILAALLAVLLLAAIPARAESSPTQVYKDYLAAVASATSLDAVFPFMAAERLKEIEGVPEADRTKLLMMIKALSPSNIQVTGEKIQGDKATLTAVGEDSTFGEKATSHGTIQLVKEGGAWKIYKEDWKTSS